MLNWPGRNAKPRGASNVHVKTSGSSRTARAIAIGVGT
jgi:hypothetical protein